MAGTRLTTRVVTPEATLSFPSLFEPDPESYNKFITQIIFDEGEDLSELEAAVANAIENKWGKDVPADVQLPWKDGDDKVKDGKYTEYAGRTYVVAKSKDTDPPMVVDRSLSPILDRKEIYGGVRAKVSLSAFAWTYMGKNGVSFYLGNVQKVADAPAFGGGVTVEDEFTAL